MVLIRIQIAWMSPWKIRTESNRTQSHHQAWQKKTRRTVSITPELPRQVVFPSSSSMLAVVCDYHQIWLAYSAQSDERQHMEGGARGESELDRVVMGIDAVIRCGRS